MGWYFLIVILVIIFITIGNSEIAEDRHSSEAEENIKQKPRKRKKDTKIIYYRGDNSRPGKPPRNLEDRDDMFQKDYNQIK